jgi:methionyl-tRNA formyltransferase
MKPKTYLHCALFLLGEKGLSVLEALLNNGYAEYISRIIIGRDENISNDCSIDIEKLATLHKIPTEERSPNIYLSDDEFGILISWKWLIKNQVNDLIVFHDSILPKYRGFNPLVTALINGDEEIGATAIFASNEIDEGEIIYQRKINITYPLKIKDAINIIAVLYAEMACDIFKEIFDKKNKLLSHPQKIENTSFSLWRDEKDYFIDWSNSSQEIERFINATSFPYDDAKTIINNQVIRITEAESLDDIYIINRTPGKLLNINIDKREATVVCGIGLIRIKKCSTLDKHTYEFRKLRTRLHSI